MAGKLTGWDDTIVALATAPGLAAIAVIRLSGRDAIPIANSLFPSKDLSKQRSHTLHVGMLRDEEGLLDEVVISLYKGPKSYTGEDVVEISCHGSVFVQEKIIAAVIATGARLAKPGEFTLRAFLNGKMDLTQAEAVADLIASNSEASRRTALHNIRGGFSDELKDLREQLIKFSALIELELDFSQEDVEFADRTQLEQLITQLQQVISRLLQSFRLGNVIRHGVQAAIIGKPNAGKSTLLNTLLNENRAIVSEIAGTTRDTIEEVLNIDGVLFRLIDTAGIRQHTSDVIETIGVARSMEKMRAADVVLYIFDVNETSAEQLEQSIKELESASVNYLLVGNKSDTGNNAAKFNGREIVFISAKEGTGIDALKQTLLRKAVTGDINTEDTIITNARHYQALQQLNDRLAEVAEGMEQKIPGDLLAIDIRQCLHYLGEITGEITNEDQLDYIFSKFCIGK
ncbi:MAG: mnmE [Chitinophagaceae bacterium]|jgi:tRNA modification GTPase|nr:mnmE [Chitinophagaceae bacterium]